MSSVAASFCPPCRTAASLAVAWGALCLLAGGTLARADTPAPATLPAVSGENGTGDTRYGPFNLLDRRSRYGAYWFPEPLRLDETDVDNELRFDWQHDQGRGAVGNV